MSSGIKFYNFINSKFAGLQKVVFGGPNRVREGDVTLLGKVSLGQSY